MTDEKTKKRKEKVGGFEAGNPGEILITDQSLRKTYTIPAENI